MARNLGTVVENNFTRGLITEATGLNFPDNAVTEAQNVVFRPKGQVRRRLGIDIESGAEALTELVDTGIWKEFVWQAVGKTGGFTFLVLQSGLGLYLFELSFDEALSQGIQPVGIDLNDYRAVGHTGDVQGECTFAAGNGALFVAHPNLDPLVIRYNSDEEWFELGRITIAIRDFDGVDDGLEVSTEPSGLSDEHHYNLRNQGWNKRVRVGSTSNEVGQGGSLGGNNQEPTITFTPLTPLGE